MSCATQSNSNSFCIIAREVFVSFFGIKSEDGFSANLKKVIGLVVRRTIYGIADYWMAIVAASLVFTMKTMQMNYLQIFLALLAFDILVAAIFYSIYERTGKDLTLAADYRRSVDVISQKSRIAGIVTRAWIVIQATIWNGPEQIAIFFRKELGSRTNTWLALIALCPIQSAFWTIIYAMGYDSVSELIKFASK